jgi:hypothetical protein
LVIFITSSYDERAAGGRLKIMSRSQDRSKRFRPAVARPERPDTTQAV